MKRIAILLGALVVAGALAMWWFSPKQVVKRRVQLLLNTLSMEKSGSKAGRKMGVYSLNAVLAPEVTLDTPTIPEANGTFDRPELESAFSWLADVAVRTEFALIGFDSVEVSESQATVALTLDSVVELPDRSLADGKYQVEFGMVQDEGTWRVESAQWDLVPSP